MEKKYHQLEELSSLIDDMNKGKKVNSDDQEILELVSLAAKVRASAASPALPEQLIWQTSETLAGDLGRRAKPKKRKWFLSGATGTVAAAVVAAVMQFSSHTVPTPPPSVLQLPEQGIIEIKQMPAEADSPQAIPQTATENTAKTVPAEPPVVARNAAPSATQDKAEAVPSRTTPVKENRVVSQAAVTPSGQEEAKQPAVVANPQKLFTLAGKAVKNTTVSDGQVRQVYIIDDSEVTVTQSAAEAAGASAARTFRAAALKSQATVAEDALAEENKASVAKQKEDAKTSEVNQVTVEKNGKTITIEGRKSKAELAKMAEELVEKE